MGAVADGDGERGRPPALSADVPANFFAFPFKLVFRFLTIFKKQGLRVYLLLHPRL